MITRLPLAVALGFVCLYLVTSPLRIDNIDGQARFEVAWALLRKGTPAPDHTGWMRIVTTVGKRAPRISYYGLGHSLLAMPLLGAAIALWGPSHVAGEIAFSLVNPLVGGALVGVFLLVLLRLGHDRKTALLSALALGGATCMWPAAVSVMEGPQVALCLLVLCLSILLREAAGKDNNVSADRRALLLGGLAMGWLGITRETDAAAALPLLALLLLGQTGRARRLRAALLVGLSALPFLAIYGGYNLWRYDSLLSTSGRMAVVRESGQPVFGHPLRALLGLTVGLDKGLLFFAPVVLAGLWGFPALRRRRRGLAAAAAGCVVLTLATLLPLAAWRGDWTWGPRYLFGVVPLILLGLPEVLRRSRRQARRALWGVGVLCAVGLVVQIAAVAVNHDRYFMEHRLGLDYIYGHGSPEQRPPPQWVYHLREALPVWRRTMARLDEDPLTHPGRSLTRGLDMASAPSLPEPNLFDKEAPAWAERYLGFDATPFFWLYYDLMTLRTISLPLRGVAVLLALLALWLLGWVAPRAARSAKLVDPIADGPADQADPIADQIERSDRRSAKPEVP